MRYSGSRTRFWQNPLTSLLALFGTPAGRPGEQPFHNPDVFRTPSVSAGAPDFLRNDFGEGEGAAIGTGQAPVDERVPVADLQKLTEIYRKIIDRYFA